MRDDNMYELYEYNKFDHNGKVKDPSHTQTHQYTCDKCGSVYTGIP